MPTTRTPGPIVRDEMLEARGRTAFPIDRGSRPASCTSTGYDGEPIRRWLPPEPSAGPASGCGWQGVTR
jgi:hypothetical protein